MENTCPRISVIIPAYKVEKYLWKCLESIESQTYSDYEVVLVDDGSPDQSGVICDQYAQKHNNAHVIHQQNQGLSAARNNGVKIAKGEFITFVDSDDYVANDYLEYLVKLIDQYDADISVGQGIKVWDDNYSGIMDRTRDTSCCLNASEAMEEMCYTRKFRGYAWGKLYRKEIVLNNPYPVGFLYEDIATTHKMIAEAKTIACGSGTIYFYRQSGNSIMRGKFNDKNFDGLRAAESQLVFISTYFPDARNAAVYKCAARINNYMFMLLSPTKVNIQIYKYLRNELKKYAPVVYSDQNVRKDFKVRCKAMEIGYIPMNLVFRSTLLLSKYKEKRKLRHM